MNKAFWTVNRNKLHLLPDMYSSNLIFFKMLYGPSVEPLRMIHKDEYIRVYKSTTAYAVLINLNHEDLTYLKLIGVDLVMLDSQRITDYIIGILRDE